MPNSHYEQHSYEDPKFPVFFHLDTLTDTSLFVPHWHENPEILYILEGEAQVTINTESVPVRSGDIIVIPSNALHSIACSKLVRYYCLIVGLDLCLSLGLPLDQISLKRKISNPGLCCRLDALAKAFSERAPYYKVQALSDILAILVDMVRNHQDPEPFNLSAAQSTRLEMLKKVFLYIEQNYARDLTTEQLAECAGFAKHYFCHVFKEMTGITPVNYINYIRCRKAKELLAVKGCSVSEAAASCGFTNLSYFTKTYKRYNGSLPSEASKTAEDDISLREVSIH